MKENRKHMGKAYDDVIIPLAPSTSEMEAGYDLFIVDVRESIRRERLKIVLNANRSMLMLYWNIGKKILEKQTNEGWGAKVTDRLSEDLKASFPETKGFSSRNPKYMRKFAECWTDYELVQRTVALIPWRSNIVLMDKLKDEVSRIWYAEKVLEYGWSKDILDFQISTKLLERQGNAVSNFKSSLPPTDSDLATHVFKDPYLFDFLGTDELRREVELENKLTEHIEKFLLELGQGFAFVGRQIHLEVGNQDFYIDLLFYHLKLRCYVVIELKATEFEPGYVSQLTMYQNVVDDLLRHSDDRPTIGLLLVKGKNKIVVEYSLSGYGNPIGVADWQQKLTRELPKDLKSSLPTVEEIEREME